MILSDALEIDLPDPAATARLGAALAAVARAGEALLLSGELGAGKSVLARGFVQALAGEDEEVPSPTFTLVQFYEAEPAVAHFDLYRLTHEGEALEIGLEEALDQGVAVIEWPERVSAQGWARLAPDRLAIELTHQGAARRARRVPHGAWKGRSLEY